MVTDAVAAAELKPGEPVLEIGPGLGVLTEALVASKAHVTAVELERVFAAALRRRFRRAEHLSVVPGSIFDLDLASYFSDQRYTVVSNLPYSITGLFLRNILTVPPRPRRAVLLLQLEVAERLTAAPGCGSLLGVLAHATGVPRLLRRVSPESFWPPPKVESALVRLDLYPGSTEQRLGVELEVLLRVARMGFAARRKTIANTLSAGLNVPRAEVLPLLAESGIGETARAQELTLEQWAKVTQIILKKFFDRSEKK